MNTTTHTHDRDEPPATPFWLQRPLAWALGLVLLAALTLGLGACATAPMPTEQIAVTMAAIGHAEAAGGQELAPTEMGMARDKLRPANRAVAAREPDQARRLAQQAQMDALLAEAKAESSRSQKAADEVQAASRALGVGSERLTATGYDEAFPVAGNDSAAGRQMNHRVQTVLSNDGGVVAPR